MDLNFIKNINLIRLAGYREFIVSEVHHNFIRLTYLQTSRNPFVSIFSDCLKNATVINSEMIKYSSESEIQGIFKKFIAGNEIADDVSLIIAIDDVRISNVRIPAETEEIDLWFLENTSKFLPEGRPSDEFVLGYEKTGQNEDYFEYSVAVGRKDYIDNLVSYHNYNQSLIAVIPGQLVFANDSSDTKRLFLDFHPDKINYTYSDEKEKIICGEIYKNIFNESGSIDSVEFDKSLSEILDILEYRQSAGDSQVVNCFVSVETTQAGLIKESLQKQLGDVVFNPVSPGISSVDITAALITNKIVNQFGDTINFKSAEQKEIKNEEIEKKAVMNSVLVSGGILILLLLLLTFSEYFVSSKLQDSQDILVEYDAKTLMFNKMLDEQNSLKTNLALLTDLKAHKINQSVFLKELSGLLNSSTCFTQISLYDDDSGIRCELLGLAYSQEDVNELMGNLEQSAGFGNIRLVYSNSVKVSRLNLSRYVPKSELFSYQINTGYNEVQ